MCDWYTYMYESPIHSEVDNWRMDREQAEQNLVRSKRVKVEEQDRRESELGWEQWVESTEEEESEPMHFNDLNDAIYEQYEKGE